MGLLFTQERRQFAPEPIIPPYLGWSGGSDTVVNTTERALGVSTVWACAGMIANSVSLMALETFTGASPDSVPRRIPDPRIVASPAAGQTQSEWLHALMMSLLLRGNGIGHIVARDQALRPTQIELLNPDKVNIRGLDDGTLEYRVNGDKIPTADVWHVRGLTLPGSKIGLSPIAYGAAQMGVELSAAKFAKDFFDGGGIPKAVLESDMDVQQEQARTLKDRLLAATRNREPVVLGNGVKYTAISVKPDESQFIATLQNAVTTVARFFFMPPEMVGGSSGNSMTYANREQRAIDFRTYCLGFWLKRIEDAYFPLLPRPQYAKFNESNLIRTDAETQAQVDVILLAGKVKAPSEIRAERNLPPMTEAQKAEADMVPLTITPKGGAKALSGIKEPPGPVAPVPADEQGGADA